MGSRGFFRLLMRLYIYIYIQFEMPWFFSFAWFSWILNLYWIRGEIRHPCQYLISVKVFRFSLLVWYWLWFCDKYPTFLLSWDMFLLSFFVKKFYHESHWIVMLNIIKGFSAPVNRVFIFLFSFVDILHWFVNIEAPLIVWIKPT